MRIIDADAYADHLENELMENLDNVKQETFTDFLIATAVIAAIASDLRNEKITPTMDADICEYSDRLWNLAYERGKNERFVTCKYCKNRPFKIHEDRESYGFNLDARMMNDFEYYCPFMCEDGWYSTMPEDDFYCKNGEWRI